MPATYSNDQLVNYAGDINTAPDKFTLGTGTFTTSGVMVYGTGTTFLTDFGGNSLYNGLGNPSTVNPHPYLFAPDFGGGEVRKVKEVISDTQMILETQFTGGSILAATPVRYVPESRTKQMSILEVSGTVVVNGITLSNNEFTGWGTTQAINFDTTEPIVIDSTSGVLHLTKFTAA